MLLIHLTFKREYILATKNMKQIINIAVALIPLLFIEDKTNSKNS